MSGTVLGILGILCGLWVFLMLTITILHLRTKWHKRRVRIEREQYFGALRNARKLTNQMNYELGLNESLLKKGTRRPTLRPKTPH